MKSTRLVSSSHSAQIQQRHELISKERRPPMTALGTSLVDRLRAIVGPEGTLTAPCDLMVYECDGFTIEKNKPEVVVFPTTTEQVVRIVRLCNELDLPFLARGAGTSLAGGCVPVGG